jgi:hypothetical protein
MKFRVTLRDQRGDTPDIDLGEYEVDDFDGEISEDECADYLLEKLSLLLDPVERA